MATSKACRAAMSTVISGSKRRRSRDPRPWPALPSSTPNIPLDVAWKLIAPGAGPVLRASIVAFGCNSAARGPRPAIRSVRAPATAGQDAEPYDTSRWTDRIHRLWLRHRSERTRSRRRARDCEGHMRHDVLQYRGKAQHRGPWRAGRKFGPRPS
jgi:hypothetical protein